eukprot:10149912-Alexandrium_andersonii.AAC.1
MRGHWQDTPARPKSCDAELCALIARILACRPRGAAQCDHVNSHLARSDVEAGVITEPDWL